MRHSQFRNTSFGPSLTAGTPSRSGRDISILQYDDRGKGDVLNRALDRISQRRSPVQDGPPTQGEAFSVVVCRSAMESAQSISALKLFLNVARQQSEPVLFLVPRGDRRAAAQAQALGARAVLADDISPDRLHEEILRLAGHGFNAAGSGIRQSTVVASDSLARIFDAAGAGGLISPSLVTVGADAVLDAIEAEGIAKWVAAIRHFDDSTFQHCLLVTGFASAFSIALGFAQSDRRLLTEAALVHDVGKTLIALSILNKPGKLDADEMAVMKTHANLGRDILAKQMGLANQHAEVAGNHHEYLDGSGYPNGLSGSELSDIVRLMTICDIFSALVERRPYRAPMLPGQAMGVLRDMGQKLDQPLVEAFGKCMLTKLC